VVLVSGRKEDFAQRRKGFAKAQLNCGFDMDFPLFCPKDSFGGERLRAWLLCNSRRKPEGKKHAK